MPRKTTRTFNPRHMFMVKHQLVGKLGNEGFEKLVAELEGLATKPKRRRSRRRRKAVAA